MNNDSTVSYSNARADESVSGITEIVLPEIDTTSSLSIVLPMLAHLSVQHDEKWFTWIAPRNVTKDLLADYGFAKHKVRLIHTRNDEECLWVFWDSLRIGNSGTVVAQLDTFSEIQRQKLESASEQGSTRGIVLRARH